MGRPPTDHGSDRYDYIEIDNPDEAPLPDWLTSDWMPCADCRANAFLKYESDVRAWNMTIAHDDGCPRLLREES